MTMVNAMNWVTILIGLLSTIDLAHLSSVPISQHEKETLKNIVLEMFDHAYGAYKEYAYPADELMPISCKGRHRGSEIDRGDIDEALGNFSLTLIDTLDTLAVLGKLDEFETQVKYVIMNVSFNADAVVSVFETNIRVLGGLLGAHSMAVSLKESRKAMLWYNGELLPKAIDVADRLLPAFNTSTGIPYPKVNLRYGVHNTNSRVNHLTDTCTACAGTMIMEFAALSRLTGKAIYETKAHKAMEALWKYRSRHSDLVGTTINIHSGDWTRRDSGVGAGIDSYYEYLLKAYILLGDDTYLEKFNKHYTAIKRYLRRGYIFVDVMMHQPGQQIREHVDSLQAFMPGLQVLKGDLKSAIEMHEILYTVSKKFNFLPEAFTTGLDVHWGQHPLRPEFIESTYFLYQATKDPYYLTVGKHVIDALEEHARVPCGYAALKDLRTLSHEDKMDSFVLAETFKYLYLLFSEESEHVININDFIFTTEAHLLPLSLSVVPSTTTTTNETEPNGEHSKPEFLEKELVEEEDDNMSCPRPMHQSNVELRSFAEHTRKKVTTSVKGHQPMSCKSTHNFASIVKKTADNILLKLNLKRPRKLLAEEFIITNNKHLAILKELGINLSMEENGKVQLVHQAATASTPEDAEEGVKFMQEMVQLAKKKGENFLGELVTRVVQLLSPPFNGKTVLPAGSAQFGFDLGQNEMGVSGEAVEANPFTACQYVNNGADFAHRVVLIQRGECMFIDKVRLAQSLNAVGVIIVDHMEGTSAENSQPFGMSGDSNPNDVRIPAVFLFRKEGDLMRKFMADQRDSDEGGMVHVRLGARAIKKYETENTDQPPAEEIPTEKDSANAFKSEKPAGEKLNKPGMSSSQVIEVGDDGSKIITTTSRFKKPDDKGVERMFTQKLIQKCPTAACDKDVTYKMQTYEEDLLASTSGPFSEETREKLAKGLEENSSDSENLNTDEQNSEKFHPVIDLKEMLDTDYSRRSVEINPINKVLSDNLENPLLESVFKKPIDDEIRHCGFPGCRDIESKMSSMSDMLQKNIDELRKTISAAETETVNSEEKMKNIDKEDRGENSGGAEAKEEVETVDNTNSEDGSSTEVDSIDLRTEDERSQADTEGREYSQHEIEANDSLQPESEVKELEELLREGEYATETKSDDDASEEKELDDNENEDILTLASNENISRTKSEL